MFKYALTAAVGFATAFAAATAAVDLKSVFQQSKNKWSPDTRILYLDDLNLKSGRYATQAYINQTSVNAVTPRWNIYSAPSYIASIRPGSEADVQKIVSLHELNV